MDDDSQKILAELRRLGALCGKTEEEIQSDFKKLEDKRAKVMGFRKESSELYTSYRRRRFFRLIGALLVIALNVSICFFILTDRIDPVKGLLLQVGCLGLMYHSANMERDDQKQTVEKT